MSMSRRPNSLIMDSSVAPSSRTSEYSGIDVPTRLTLVLIILSDWVAGELWPFKLPLRVLAVVGLVLPPLHRSPQLWLLVAAFMSARTYHQWFSQDNHLFLLCYWSIGLALVLRLNAPENILPMTARGLIGWSFLFAVIWKLFLSPDFRSGAYFHYTFVSDKRFEHFGRLLGGMTARQYAINYSRLKLTSSSLGNVVALTDTARIVTLAQLATWWTIGIESLIAASFLVPTRFRLSRYRDAFLLVFGVTTYSVATVKTFGWTLMTLGYAQTQSNEREVVRLAYLITCLLILSYAYVPMLGYVGAILRVQ